MSFNLRFTLPAIISSLLTTPAFAATSNWKIDPSHSSAGFSVKHMMISNVKGSFTKLDGTIDYDGKNLKSIAVKANIDPASINTADSNRDEHLMGKDFFDVEHYPTVTFKSKKIKAEGKDKFALTGDLTMKGITKEVTLLVDGPTQEIKDMKGNKRVGASATTTINRKDFNITYGGLMDNGGAMIGDKVPVSIEIEAIKIQ
jgi:polyisoprenoid-binding protein YceI